MDTKFSTTDFSDNMSKDEYVFENFDHLESEENVFITTDEQREWFEGWAEKWMARGILSPFVESGKGELNYVTFEMGQDNTFYCILSCSEISEIKKVQYEMSPVSAHGTDLRL